MSGKQKQIEASTSNLAQGQLEQVVQKILRGSVHVISHAGASQYARPGGGVSACGLAALNCARVVLGKEQDGLRDDALLQNLMSLETAREIMSICTQWSTEAHLEVEEIYKVPIFTRYMRLVSTKYSRPGFKQFKTLLTELAVIDTSAAVIITRPPEIIACVKISVHGEPLFLIFDSHPRPCHPNGAGFIFSTSINYTANHLNDLLSVDRRLLDGDMQWQAQLLANFSGHTFVHIRDNPADLTQTILESSLAILALQAEVADMKYRNSSLEDNNKRLEQKANDAEMKHRRSFDLYGSPPSQAWNRNTTIGLSGYSHPWTPVRYVDNRPGTSCKSSASRESSSYAHAAAKPSPYLEGSSYSTHNLDVGYPPSRSIAAGSTQDSMNQHADEDLALAVAIEKQREFEEEDRRLREERESLANVASAMFSCGICLEEQSEDYSPRHTLKEAHIPLTIWMSAIPPLGQ
jgi:hypothetical protein